MKKHRALSEGEMVSHFILNEMDYYTPDFSDQEEDFFDDSMEADPLDYNTGDDTMIPPDFDEINNDYSDLDAYADDETDLDDELEGDDSFLLDVNNDIDYMDDEEEDFYDNDLSSEVPMPSDNSEAFFNR